VLAALYVYGSSVKVSAKVTFLYIERPPHGFRYTGSVWPRIHYLGNVDTSCRLIFEDGVEAFDGDTVELAMGFLDDTIHEARIYNGMPFELFVMDIKIAEGQILNIEK
tara:strand:+ start:515 stop:838 length:324 start_codon:yes stop_codon:yes gene_type:complete